MPDLGVIQEDVQFDWVKAGDLSGGAGAWAGGATATSSALARVGTQVVVNTGTNVAGGMVTRGIEGQNPFDAQGIAVDTLTGTVTGSLDSATTALHGTNLDSAVGGVRVAPLDDATSAGLPRTFTYGDPGPGALGSTDKFGNITIRPGLSEQDFVETLRHETVPLEGAAVAGGTGAAVYGGYEALSGD